MKVDKSWNNAFVTFNNQDSVLMTMPVPEFNLLCLLHDNRIFAFRKEHQESQEFNEDTESSSTSQEQNVMLNLLTTPKYRGMGALYIIFRLLDNISLLLIIILSVINVCNGKPLITAPSAAQYALLSAIGLEVFYDVMLYTHRYWFLQRLSLYIGIVLYCIYASIVGFKIWNNDYNELEVKIVVSVLSVRFVAFILEEFVDIAIDSELHNDLLRLQDLAQGEVKGQHQIPPLNHDPESLSISSKKPILRSISCLLSYIELRKYTDITKTVRMPPNVIYVGSFFAWSAKSVFTKDVWRQGAFPRLPICLLCLIPFLVATVLIFFILLLAFMAFCFPIVLSFLVGVCCLRTWSFTAIKEHVRMSNFYRELTHF